MVTRYPTDFPIPNFPYPPAPDRGGDVNPGNGELPDENRLLPTIIDRLGVLDAGTLDLTRTVNHLADRLLGSEEDGPGVDAKSSENCLTDGDINKVFNALNRLEQNLRVAGREIARLQRL